MPKGIQNHVQSISRPQKANAQRTKSHKAGNPEMQTRTKHVDTQLSHCKKPNRYCTMNSRTLHIHLSFLVQEAKRKHGGGLARRASGYIYIYIYIYIYLYIYIYIYIYVQIK